MVTAAVEKLLGLSFEHFCQCVVLPQGEFAEFLRAKGADRREILLKLLGAGLYREIGQAGQQPRVPGRAASHPAGRPIGRLTSMPPLKRKRLLPNGNRRCSRSPRVELAVPRLRAAHRRGRPGRANPRPAHRRARPADVDPAAGRRHRTRHRHDRPSAGPAARPRMPNGRHSAADVAARAGPRRRTGSRAPGTGAPGARRAAPDPDRCPVCPHGRRGGGHPARAGGPSSPRPQPVRRSRPPQMLVTPLPVTPRRLPAPSLIDSPPRAESLSAVTLPGGLAELDRPHPHRRWGTPGVRRNAWPPPRERDAEARAAVRNAPRRAPLELTLRQVAELAAATAARGADAEKQRAPAADRDQLRTQSDLAAATAAPRQGPSRPRQGRPSRMRAAALRPHLVAGDACPVCEQVVTTLPPPAARAETRRSREGRGRSGCQSAEGPRRGSQRPRSWWPLSTPSWPLPTERVGCACNPRWTVNRPTRPSSRRRSSGLDRLERRGSGPPTKSVQAGTAAVRRCPRRRYARWRRMRRSCADPCSSVRDPLVALGAPAVDGSHLMAAWTQLTEWAADAAETPGVRRSLGARTADDAARGCAAPRREGLSRGANPRRAGTQGGDGGHRTPRSGSRAALKGTADPAGRTHRVPVRCAQRRRGAGATGADRLSSPLTVPRRRCRAVTAARSSREQAEDVDAGAGPARCRARGRDCARLGMG